MSEYCPNQLEEIQKTAKQAEMIEKNKQAANAMLKRIQMQLASQVSVIRIGNDRYI